MVVSSFELELQVLIEEFHREAKVPGICVAVSANGQRTSVVAGNVVANESAPMTGASQFHLGNITKLLLSVVTLELAWDGCLDLSASIEEYLPELRGSVHGHAVTLSHLLSHTGGYHGTEMRDREACYFTWEGFVEYLRNAPQNFEPGTVFSYEHTGAVLIGRIIHRVVAKDCLDLIYERIFEALGLSPGRIQSGGLGSDTQIGQHNFDPETGRYVKVAWSDVFGTDHSPFPSFWLSALSVYTVSMIDLVRVGELLAGCVNEGGHDSGLVSAATLSQLQRPVVQLPRFVGGPLSELLPAAFSLGASRYRDRSYGLSSVTVGQCVGLRFNPENGTSIAVGVNAMCPYLRDMVLDSVSNILDGTRPVLPDQLFELELSEFEGTYRGGGHGKIVARFEKECLVCEIGTTESQQTLSARVVLDDEGRLTMASSAPSLSMGFLGATERREAAMMINLAAYKNVGGRADTPNRKTMR